MALFDSLIEFIGSGLIVASTDSLVVEAQNGPLRLSAFNGSGVLDFDQGSGHWRLQNAGETQPIMSGINGVSGPEITLVGGPNITITPNPGLNSITIDASGTSGGITNINSETGPNISIVGSSGTQVTTSTNTINIAHDVVGYKEVVSGYMGNQVFTHNLGTTFIVPSFKADSGPGGVPNTVFEPRRVQILNANQISVRMSRAINFEMTLIGYKGI